MPKIQKSPVVPLVASREPSKPTPADAQAPTPSGDGWLGVVFAGVRTPPAVPQSPPPPRTPSSFNGGSVVGAVLGGLGLPRDSPSNGRVVRSPAEAKKADEASWAAWEARQRAAFEAGGWGKPTSEVKPTVANPTRDRGTEE